MLVGRADMVVEPVLGVHGCMVGGSVPLGTMVVLDVVSMDRVVPRRAKGERAAQNGRRKDQGFQHVQHLGSALDRKVPLVWQTKIRSGAHRAGSALRRRPMTARTNGSKRVSTCSEKGLLRARAPGDGEVATHGSTVLSVGVAVDVGQKTLLGQSV